MIKNYFKIALRNLIKHKGYSFINIAGLTVGITVCLLMLMYVVIETSFDDFQANKERIYRVSVEWGDEGSKMKFAGSMPAIAPALNDNVPDVKVAARLQPDYNTVIITDDNEEVKEENLFFADPEIFEILTFDLIKGKKSEVLSQPFSLVISEKASRRYFGKDDPVNKTLNYNGTLLKVTGIIKDLPSNSHLDCRFIVSYSTLKSLGRMAEMPWNQWGDDLNYFLLNENGDINKVRETLENLMTQNAGEWMSSRMKFMINNISDIHWNTELRGDIGTKGNITYIYLFLSASILILLIACFNFVNLTISKNLDRKKEIGVRKVVGANRSQLMVQHLVESMIIVFISIVIGFILFEVIQNKFYSFLESGAVLTGSHLILLYAIIISMLIFLGFVGGGYPALYLSKFKPADILKGGLEKSPGKMPLRKILVISQFVISIILVVGTIVIFRQIDFMKNSDLGFVKQDVLLIQFPFINQPAGQKYSVLRDELLKNPNIINVSGAYTVPGVNSQFNKSINKKGAPPEESRTFQCLPADYGYVESMGLAIVKGRDFSRDFISDERESIILNESAVKALGLINPIGERFVIPSNGSQNEMTVIGVVKDFHVKSLHNKIEPIFIHIEPASFINIAVKIKSENYSETVSYIEKIWKEVLPNMSLNYRYLEDAYDSYYRAEEKTQNLLSAFTGLAVFISCLGLLGIASFMMESRIKEVGIRKVLGATVSGIAGLLSKQFAVWVLAANIFAWPAAYYLVNLWLENFAYRVNIGLMPFIFAGLLILGIALLTVGYQTVKTAMANPVESLRNE